MYLEIIKMNNVVNVGIGEQDNDSNGLNQLSLCTLRMLHVMK